MQPVCATYSAHLVLLDLITRTIFGEEYRSLSSSLCCLLHSPDTLPHLGSNTFLSTLILEQPQPMFHPQYERPSFTLIQKTGKIAALYTLIFTFLYSKLESKLFFTEAP
jgi:hypothetical protein